NSLPTNLWMVKNAMGAISEQRNNYGEAVEYYLESLKMDNKNSQCFDRLIMLIHTQPEQEIILFINTLYNLEDEA
ncbi:MAG TPA: glycosyltransferase family 2 protein, partial [Sporomusaceae bacterium]|nr:glycosyltransferase family 2 protein [Sporomusaceae bacterium]